MTEALGKVATLYDNALKNFLAQSGESWLEQAYEIGRQALAGGLGIIDMAAIRQETMSRLVEAAKGRQAQGRLIERAGTFSMESLATFEMAHRGYQEANAAFKALNETLEARVEARTEELRTSEGRYRVQVDGVDAVVWEATPPGGSFLSSATAPRRCSVSQRRTG